MDLKAHHKVAIGLTALLSGALVMVFTLNFEEQQTHPPLAMADSVLGVNSPSDRFFNFTNQEYPSFKVWWEIENWNANADDIAHIESIEIELFETDFTLWNEKESRLTIKGIEVFDNLIHNTANSQTTNFFDLDPEVTSSGTKFIWRIDTDYLVQGDITYVDWDLEKVVTNPRNHPIIFFKMIFQDDEESLKRLLELETVRAVLEVTIKNYDETGTFEGWTTFSDGVYFVFYEKEKPIDYSERFWERRN